MTDAGITLAKAAQRQAAMAARKAGGDQAALTANLQRALSETVAGKGAGASSDWRGAVLAGYWPMRGEPDPLPAMRVHDGPICLPVVPGQGVPLIFRLWRGEALIPGPFGTSHPPDSAPEVTPDVLIVPLLAFDAGLNRLGYGGGYYDRTLEMLRATRPVRAIGLAWAVQQIAALPIEPTDQPLDLLVTDRGVLFS